MTTIEKISISVVSHGQGNLIENLLHDMRTFRGPSFEILLTLNIPEDKEFISRFSDLPIVLIENNRPKGFGENHNSAFERSRGDIFVVVNPDIRAPELDLNELIALAAQPAVGACAPKVLSAVGKVEDSARCFPTITRLLNRTLLRRRVADYDLSTSRSIVVDWVAGMFVAFPRPAFEAVGGFDARYFMYMEDADICRRLKRRGYQTVVDCSTSVVHDAQRASRRSARHFRWHLRSAVRFLTGF